MDYTGAIQSTYNDADIINRKTSDNSDFYYNSSSPLSRPPDNNNNTQFSNNTHIHNITTIPNPNSSDNYVNINSSNEGSTGTSGNITPQNINYNHVNGGLANGRMPSVPEADEEGMKMFVKNIDSLSYQPLQETGEYQNGEYKNNEYKNNEYQTKDSGLNRLSTSQDPISTSIQSIRSESVFEEPLNGSEYVNQSNLSPVIKQENKHLNNQDI